MKKLIVKIDKIIFRGLFLRCYIKLKTKLNSSNTFFKNKKSVVINEPVYDMILMQKNRNNYSTYEFYDGAVRLLALENYYHKNNFGFDLYKKMHTRGNNYGETNLAEKYYKKMHSKKRSTEYGKVPEYHSVQQFKNLIKSYEKNGYDDTSYIMADRNLISMNGAHRITMSLYRNQEFMNVEVKNCDFSRRFNYEWFWENGFDKKELKLISEKMNNIIDDCKEKIGDYYCILFPPAVKFFDQITEDIKCIQSDNITVTGYTDKVMEVNEFVGFLKLLYSFDSILPVNLERKLFYILSASEIKDGKVPFRIVSLNIKDPMYRLKSDNGMPESVATVKLKQAIRERYKNKDAKFTKKYKKGYNHDVIIHSTDNYLSNKALRIIQEINTDISALFNEIKDLNYALVESGQEKLSKSFPRNFYMNDDIDILVLNKDLNEIVEKTEKFCKKHFGNLEWVEIKKVKTHCGARVIVTLRDKIIVMFDFLVTIPFLTESFINKALSNVVKGEYNYVKIEDEIIIRLAKYAERPQKEWHKKFIEQNSKYICFDASDYTKSKYIKKVLDKINKE